jgi:hypothetical protein
MQAKPVFVLIGLLAAIACVPPTPSTVSTPATIVRVEFIGSVPHEFRYCEVRLGWTEGQLTSACGYPIDTLQRAGLGDGERCLIYDSISHSLAIDNRGAPFFAVCMRNIDAEAREERRRLERSTLRQDAEVVIEDRAENMEWTVIDVYGLSTYPGDRP